MNKGHGQMTFKESGSRETDGGEYVMRWREGGYRSSRQETALFLI